MNRLFEIATELGEIARNRFQCRADLENVQRSIKQAETTLISGVVWPGSNDAQRKAAEAQSRASSDVLANLNYNLNNFQDTLNKLEADREALIAERDAWQWTIRDNEVTLGNQAQSGRSVFVEMLAFQNHTPEAPSSSAS